MIDNVNQSKLIDKLVIAVSPNTPETVEYLKSLDGDFEILDTSGDDYLTDLSYILDYFEKQSSEDILLLLMPIYRLYRPKPLILLWIII